MNRLFNYLTVVLPICFGTLALAAPPPGDAIGVLPSPVVAAAKPSAPDAGTAPFTSTASSYVNDDKHQLIPGDKVSFQIIEDRSLPVSLQVTESSELDIPYIGRLKVAGRTCKQLADATKELLEKDYYKRATVIVGLDALAKVVGRVYVWGPVRNQGPIEIPSNESFTAGKAIVRAGGFGDFANRKEVKVVRKTPGGNVTLKVNLVDVLEKGKTDQDILLEPEDFIIVPQRAINW